MADQPSPESKPAKPRRWFGWKFKLLAAGLALLVLVGFAPQIVAHTPLKNWLVARAAGDVRGTVIVGRMNLGWFSAPELFDVELRDEQDRLILQAPRVSMGRTLLGLALQQADLGVVTVERPVVDLVAMGDETNLEKALAAYFEGEPTSPTRTSIDLVLHGGKLILRDEDVRTTWNAGDLEATVTVPAERTLPIKLAVRGAIEVDRRAAKADLTIEYRTGLGAPGLAPQVTVETNAEALPAAAVAVFLRRFEPGLRLDGLAAGRLKIVWDDADADHPTLLVDGHIVGRNVSIVDPRLSPERFDFAALDLPCKFTWSDDRIVSEKSRVQCDLGEASFSGSIDLSRGPFGILEASGVSASCDIDLAKLSRLLAKPLRIQPGTRITNGRLTGEVRSTTENGAVSWAARLQAMDLHGEHQGQPLVWRKPISAHFAARQAPGGLPRVDLLRVITEFGNLDASGSAEQFTMNGDLDLGLLAQKLGQFVDLGGIKPAGTARGQLAVMRRPDDSFVVKGEGQLRDFALALKDGTFRETELSVKLDVAGKMNGPAYRLDSAGLHLFAGQDRFDIELLEPVSDLAYVRDGTIRAELHGDLARWRGWIAQFVNWPNGWELAGTADAVARVRLGSTGLEVDSAQANVTNLRFVGAGLNVAEPRLRIKPGSIKWDRKSGRLELADAELSSSAVAARLTTLVVDPTDTGMTATAKGRINGDAAQLQRWLPSLTTEPISGTLDGPFDLRAEGGRIHGGAELSLRSLILGDPKNPTWNEAHVRLVVRGRFEPTADLAVLDEFKVEASALSVNASGRVGRLGTTRDVLLTGELAYDLEKWEPQLRRLLGKDALVKGRDRKPFRLEGSLASSKPASGAAASPLALLKGEASFGWQDVRAFGLDVGPATIRARMMGDAWIRFDPIDATLNHGKLKLEPYIRLDPAPMILAFGKATTIERVKLTPDLSASAIGFVAPFLAGVRDPQGEVSVIIDGGQIPLADPDQADVWGKVIIHSARATPGPLLVQVGNLLRSPANLNLPKEIVVPFRAVKGRVYHENLEVPMGDITVKTSGSVGFDGTLALTAEVTVPPRWFKNPPKTAPKVKLPIGGTLSNPRIDERGLQDLVRDKITDAAGDALKREVEKGLQKWFQPPKK